MLKILIPLFIFSISFAKEEIKFGVTQKAYQSSKIQKVIKLYEQVFNNLNYKMIVEVLPAARLETYVEKGLVDGELVRMSSYGKKRSYLTKVEEPHFRFSIAAYSNKEKKGDWKVSDSKTIGYRRGVIVVEKQIQKNFKKKKATSFTNVTRALRLVNRNRLDSYIGVEYLTDEVIKKMAKEEKENIVKIKVLSKDSAHMFLGEKHARLAPRVSKELKKIKRLRSNRK